MKKLLLILGIWPLVLLSFNSYSQSTGYIIRPANLANSKSVLDAGAPSGWTSKTTAGFGGDDVTNSKIPFKPVPALSYEPFGDLRRGPNHLYSDFVPDANGNGYYMYYDGANLLFRFRLGSLVPGAKGYSILLDTDNKFGATGPNADPNYQAATTGTNGNAGFEVEIDLFTQNTSAPGVAIYDVDGVSTPVLKKSYNDWQNYSQVSIAGTSDNGDPDFFVDFYIPFSDLTSLFGITASTPLRMSATTVMAPQSAIGGPKSDIYGLNDNNYGDPNAAYMAIINAQPALAVASWSGSTYTSPITAMCTAAPTVSSPINAGTETVQGTWTKNNIAAASGTATITVYVNGTAVGTTNVSSGNIWSVPGIIVKSGDIVTAKAQAAGESACYTSNAVVIESCTSKTPVTSLNFTCANGRGMGGTRGSSTQVVKLYNMNASGPTLFATDGTVTSPSGYLITYSGTTWAYNGQNNSGQADPCSGGPNDIPNGSYYYTVTEAGQCESAPIFVAATGVSPCIGVTATGTPTISQTNLYSGATYISGTVAVSGSTVMLYKNGSPVNSIVASGTNYSFTNLSLVTGDVINIYAWVNGSCISNAVSKTVSGCSTLAPVISTNNGGQLNIGQPVTGFSAEAAGTIIKVYTSDNTLVATTTVQGNGYWSTTSPAYTTVANTTYYATAQNSTCSLSANSASVPTASGTTSAARCGSINGPVTSGATTVSGTLVSSATATTVNIYMDGYLIGSAANIANTTNWGPIDVTNKLYPYGVLTIGIQETGKEEVICGNSFIVSCSTPPASPTISPATTTIVQNKSVTYTISNVVTGNYYGIADNTTGQSLADGVWATSNADITIATKPITAAGTYNVVVKSTSLSGGIMCSSVPTAAKVNVTQTLPVDLVSFKGWKTDKAVMLEWSTATEMNTTYFEVERSADGISFKAIGNEAAIGGISKNTYNYTDGTPFSGINLYRLKIVDNDGKYTYSNIIKINNSTKLITQLMPNPASGGTNLFIVSASEQPAVVDLLNMNGSVLMSRHITLHYGNNTIRIIDINRYTKGTYIVKVATGEDIQYLKLMIQ